MTLIPIQSNRISEYGGINELFHAIDHSKVRAMVSAAFVRLQDDNPASLAAFRARMEKQYPYEKNDLVPLPTDIVVPSDSNLFVLENIQDDDGNNVRKTISHISPGAHKPFVYLEHGDGRPLTENVLKCVGGFNLVHHHGNCYAMTVSPLVHVDENGKQTPVIPSEYCHSERYLPKSDLFCETVSGKYHFSLKVDIPKRASRGGGPNSQTGKDNRTKAETLEVYKEMASGLWGFYKNMRLYLNKDNPGIIEMASFNREAHPTLYRRFTDIYKKAADVAGAAFRSMSVIKPPDYLPRYSTEYSLRYGEVEAFLVNTYLDQYFVSEEVMAFRKDVRAIQMSAQPLASVPVLEEEPKSTDIFANT